MFYSVLKLSALISMSLVDATPADVLSQIERETQFKAFDNLSLNANWKESSNGRPTRWEEQTLHADKLGRLRMTTRGGPFEVNGNRGRDADQSEVTDRIYDGEKTATVEFFSKKDRVGKPIQGPKPSAGYRPVQIQQGMWPAGYDLFGGYHNPLTFVGNEAVAGLVESFAAGREVSLSAVNGQAGTHILEFTRDKGREVFGSVRGEALLDSKRGWLPIRVDALDEKGRVVRRATCEYLHTSNGFWVPTRGSMKHFGSRALNETPLWETQFDVKQVVLNDPRFDDSAFQIVLPPDTPVSDIRYGVVYRVGDEQVLGNQLKLLAEKALQEQQETRELIAGRTPWLGRWIFLGITAMVILAVFSFAIRRRVRASGR